MAVPQLDPSKAARNLPVTIVGVLFLIGAALWLARSILVPIALAILLAFILTPVVLHLHRKGMNRNLAVVVVSLVTFGTAGGLVVAISAQLRELARDLNTHKERIQSKLQDVTGGKGPGIVGNLTAMIDEITADLQTPDPEGEADLTVEVKEEKTGLDLLPLLAQPLVSVVASIFLVIALTVSILLRREDLRNRILRLVGHGHLASTTRAMDEATRLISRYLLVQVILNASFGALFAIGLFLMGVPYAFLWGFLTAVTRFVPYVGTWIGVAFPVLLSLAVFDGWTEPILVITWALLLGIATNNFLEPLLFSRSTGLSPIALVVATAFWTWLWGPIGLVLATPMTVCLAVMGRYIPSLRFFDILLGTRPALEPQYSYYQRLLAEDEGEAAELVEEYLQDHGADKLCDEVIVPALARARFDRDRGHLDNPGLAAIAHRTEEIFHTAISEMDEFSTSGSTVLLLGCPARDVLDTTSLHLLDGVLGRHAEIEVLPDEMVTSEMLDRIGKAKPAGVCLATIAPGGQAQLRYLCKRLRRERPELMIIVCYWGGGEEQRDAVKERFLQAGANMVLRSLQEAREELTPHLQLLPHLKAGVGLEELAGH